MCIPSAERTHFCQSRTFESEVLFCRIPMLILKLGKELSRFACNTWAKEPWRCGGLQRSTTSLLGDRDTALPSRDLITPKRSCSNFAHLGQIKGAARPPFRTKALRQITHTRRQTDPPPFAAVKPRQINSGAGTVALDASAFHGTPVGRYVAHALGTPHRQLPKKESIPGLQDT